MKKDSSWMDRAKGNNAGTRLFIWIISKIGILPAYFILFFASVQYTILDRRSRIVLQEFRNHAGLKCNVIDLFLHFYSFGMSLIDRYAFLITGKQFFSISTHNEELIVNELQKGKGVILIGAHFGNWELAGNLLQDRLNSKVNLLMVDAESDAVKTTVSKATENRLVNIIYIGNDAADTTVALVNALQRGEIVCLHGDRVFGNQRFEEVAFLGRKARFPIGPFLLSAATGSPVVPIFSMKTGLFRYSFSALHPFSFENVPRTQRIEKIRSACQNYVCELEKMVRKHPLQWFNFYHFWG